MKVGKNILIPQMPLPRSQKELKEIIWEKDFSPIDNKRSLRTQILNSSSPLCSKKLKILNQFRAKMMKRMIVSFRQPGGLALYAPFTMISQREDAELVVN